MIEYNITHFVFVTSRKSTGFDVYSAGNKKSRRYYCAAKTHDEAIMKELKKCGLEQYRKVKVHSESNIFAVWMVEKHE